MSDRVIKSQNCVHSSQEKTFWFSLACLCRRINFKARIDPQVAKKKIAIAWLLWLMTLFPLTDSTKCKGICNIVCFECGKHNLRVSFPEAQRTGKKITNCYFMWWIIFSYILIIQIIDSFNVTPVWTIFCMMMHRHNACDILMIWYQRNIHRPDFFVITSVI